MFNIFSLLLIVFGILVNPSSVSAFKAETFVTLSNPVTGYDGWNSPTQTPLDLPKFIYEESTPSALPLTWLLRSDAIESSTISAFFTKITSKDKNQSLGLFLSITPELASRLNISFPSDAYPNTNRVFLTSYQNAERKQIIDYYMSIFFDRFGYYPKSVLAWHLDSYSLQYLQEKYSVLTAMDQDEQYNVDQNRLWGGYIGSPYFPDKNNSLLPAKSLANRINLAMVRWAPKDFYNFYGAGSSSMYSFQAKDYFGLGLKHEYFQKLLNQYSQKNFNEFTQFNLGFENNLSLFQYREEIKKIFKDLTVYKGPYNLRPISLADFGDWFKARYPESSPAYFYRSKDPIEKSPEEVTWYQSPWFRLGLKSKDGQTIIADLRIYDRHVYEEYYSTPNTTASLQHEVPAIIDTVKDASQQYSFDFDLVNSILKYNKYTDFWEATLVNGEKRLVLDPDKITFIGVTPPSLNNPSIKVIKKQNSIVWQFVPQTPFKNKINSFWILVAIIAIYLFIKSNKPPFFGLAIAILAGTTLYRSGLLYSFGMGFWGPNGHDALFHLSIIEHFRQNPFSLSHPQFAGAVLKDYHFLFDYLLGILSKITFTAPSTLYFIIFPLFSAVALVLLLNRLLALWKYSPLEKNLAYIFVFLGGSLGFIPRILSGQNIFSGESAFWANQSFSMFLNPPFILSIIILLVFLNKIYDLQSTANNLRSTIYDLLTLSLLGGLLAQTKVYAFILLLGALFLNKKYKLFAGVLLVGVLITLPFISFSGSPFIFQPLWFTNSLFASPDRVYWPKLVQAWQTYELAGPVFKLLLVNFFAIFIFIVGNLGFRLLGFLSFKTNNTQSFLLSKSIIILGLIIPLVITQKVNPWNTIQFLYYSLFFLGLLSGKYLGSWHGSKLSPKSLVLVVVVSLSIFTSIGTFKDYFTYQSASRVGYTELLALNVLKSQPKGVVVSPIFQNNTVSNPKPQYSYVSSSYISALTGQTEFLSDTINLDITGIDYASRYNNIQKLYNTTDKVWVKQFLQSSNISYVLETPLKSLKVQPADVGLMPIFDSNEIKLYKVGN